MCTNICKYCNGTGGKVMTKLWAPGEAQANNDAMNEVESEESEQDVSSSVSSSDGGVCPKCGGTGYYPEAHQYYPSSRYAPYHNSVGSTCPILARLPIITIAAASIVREADARQAICRLRPEISAACPTCAQLEKYCNLCRKSSS